MKPKYRIVAILTTDDGDICEQGRLISAPKDNWGRQPLFKLKHQEFVPLEDVKKLEEEIDSLNDQLLEMGEYDD